MSKSPKTTTLYEYDIPESCGGAVRAVAMRELTVEDERHAHARAGSNAMALAYELCKQSVAQVNGKPVSTADNTADDAWDAMSPKCRALVLGAYSELHQPVEAEAATFRQSRRTIVG